MRIGRILKKMFGICADDLISCGQLLLYCIAAFVELAVVQGKSFGYYVDFSCELIYVWGNFFSYASVYNLPFKF